MSAGLNHFSVTAAAASVGLEMVSDKTVFSLEEVQKGEASAVIYVDVTNELTEDDKAVSIGFELAPETWGTVDPKNLLICEPNQLGTKRGYSPSKGAYSSLGSYATSEWVGDVPETHGYMFTNYANEAKYTGPSDDFKANACVMSDSTKGPLVTGGSGAGKHFVQFEVFLPENLGVGEYSINFTNVSGTAGEIVDGNYIQNDLVFGSTKGITLTVTDKPIVNDDFLLGDANLDKKVNVRDCAAIASALAKGTTDTLPDKESDYNKDGKINVRDAAAIASALAGGKIAE